MNNKRLENNDILWGDLYEEGCGTITKEEHSVICERFWKSGPIYEYKGFAIKCFIEEREIELTELAGDCSVRVYGHVIKFDVGPNKDPRKIGLVMEIATPLLDYAQNLDEAEKHKIKAEMIALVERLHTKYNMVHGDIKPDNFLVCQNNKIRLCDFEGARSLDESVEIWESLEGLALNGKYSRAYINKMRNDFTPPTTDDDWYALAISIWQIYTGKVPFDGIGSGSGETITLHHRTGETVDLSKVKDIETREWIRKILRKGGAFV